MTKIRDKNTYIQEHAAEDSIFGRDWWWVVGVQVKQQVQFSSNAEFIAGSVENVLKVGVMKSRENMIEVITIKKSQNSDYSRQFNCNDVKRTNACGELALVTQMKPIDTLGELKSPKWIKSKWLNSINLPPKLVEVTLTIRQRFYQSCDRG